MTTLFQVLVQAARNLQALQESIATGGSATTIVDSVLAALAWPDDSFNGGTAFLIRDAGGSAAAPEKESRVVSDFVGSSGTVTTAAFSQAVAAGDSYGVISNRYPRGLLVSKVNEALQELGDVPTVDMSSLTTAADTREYSLPVACKKDLRQVWIAQDTAAPYRWEEVLSVYVEWGAANAVGKLIFPYQPPTGLKLKLVYEAAHGYVQADSDVISDYLSADWLATEAAVRCAKFRLNGPGSDEKNLTNLVNDLLVQAERGRRRRRVNWPQSFPVLPYGGEDVRSAV